MEFITATVRQREASIALADGRELGGQVGKVIGDQMYDLDLALDAALQRVRIPQARRVGTASRGAVRIARLTRGRSPPTLCGGQVPASGHPQRPTCVIRDGAGPPGIRQCPLCRHEAEVNSGH
jgi:hypothetical protein